MHLRGSTSEHVKNQEHDFAFLTISRILQWSSLFITFSRAATASRLLVIGMKRACSWVGGFYVLLKRAATTATRQLVVYVTNWWNKK